MKPLSDSMRCTRVRDLEHHCRCYVNGYIQELEGKRGGSGGASLEEARARQWKVLCELMFGILVQEGLVEPFGDAPESEEEDDP